MKRNWLQPAVVVLTTLAILAPAPAAAAKAKAKAKAGGSSKAAAAEPAGPAYVGVISLDATSGRVLFEDKADAPGHPASTLKLMDLLIILEKIEAGTLKLNDTVTVTAESSTIGGSQVYLKEHETFIVDEMLYALMIQSANDAATALAIHVAGSKDAFVGMMNKRAQELGMASTVFRSVHGLPPGKGQEPDVTTARDMSKLCLEVLKHKDALRYTSTRERPFRPNAKEPFIMRTHNHLLGSFEGCDGLKTGYYREAGFTIACTAERNGKRVLAVVMGSPTRPVRDAKACELMAQGLLAIPDAPPAAVPAAAPSELSPAAAVKK
jgi:D-alanyl-D-alanine carboxypeptidase (penicillin-binding protein 5/6)